MIILGVQSGHNATAALMRDGSLVGLIHEERLTKRKNQTGFPAKAIEALVRHHLGGDFSRVDRVVLAGAMGSLYWSALDHYADFSVQDYIDEMYEYWQPYFYGDRRQKDAVFFDDYWRQQYLAGKKLNSDHNFDFSFIADMDSRQAFDHFNKVERFAPFKRMFDWQKEIDVVGHHECHAYYALYGGALTPEQRAEALVLTGDSQGDNDNWTAWLPEADGHLQIQGRGLENTVGRIYKFATLILGMKPNEHEYKVMGLAPYARPGKYVGAVEKVFFEALDFRDGSFVSDKPLIDSYFDLKRRLEGHRFDNISAGLQNWASVVTRGWVRHWLQKTGRRGLCFSGGLSMNIRINGDILAMPEVDWLSVPGSGGDETLSAGACYRIALDHRQAVTPVQHGYLGEPADEATDAWQAGVRLAGANTADFAIREGVDAGAAAKLLAADRVLSRCVGASEYGARALGNRSILANPSNPENLHRINRAIKNRDFWMPFTPSILAEYADECLINPKRLHSPAMTIGFDSQAEWRDKLAAALHPADYSARPQMVTREANAGYWDLIEAFRRLTGIPALLNTSLNLHGDPMNYDVPDAARTMALSGLDYLLLPGDRLLYKRKVEAELAAILGSV